MSRCKEGSGWQVLILPAGLRIWILSRFLGQGAVGELGCAPRHPWERVWCAPACPQGVKPQVTWRRCVPVLWGQVLQQEGSSCAVSSRFPASRSLGFAQIHF